MSEVRYPEDFSPESAPKWFEAWGRVRNEPDLTILAPTKRGRVVPAVLMASCVASRRELGWDTQFKFESEFTMPDIALSMAGEAGVVMAFGKEGSARSVLGSLQNLSLARMSATKVVESLEARSSAVAPSVVRMLRFVFEELGANIVQHSQASRTGFGWADVDDNASRLELAFADCGIGFRASLQKNPDLLGRVSDDAEALQLALTAGVSGTGPSHSNMGWGLKALIDFSDLLGGDLFLASGSAMLVRKTLVGQRTNRLRSIPHWQGSWICLDAPLR